jgi:branched-chain amino acid transport system substrate-binding protein
VTRTADAIDLVRNMVRQNVRPMGVISPGAPGFYDEEFYRALGPLADYHIVTTAWANPKAGMTRALEAAFKVEQPKFRFGVECFNVGFTFEALLIAADAFRRAGVVDGGELVKALRTTNLVEHVIIGPPIKFDEKGQNTSIPSVCIQNRERTPNVVLPGDIASMAPMLPEPAWQGRH